MSATRISSLQFPLLRAFMERGYFDIEHAQAYDQRPFRSFLIRGWITYKPGKGFHVTREGVAAWEDFHHHNIARKNPALPLTAYFDASIYGLVKPKAKPKAKKASTRPANVREFRRMAGAA